VTQNLPSTIDAKRELQRGRGKAVQFLQSLNRHPSLLRKRKERRELWKIVFRI
jgi:hypothetical protein